MIAPPEKSKAILRKVINKVSVMPSVLSAILTPVILMFSLVLAKKTFPSSGPETLCIALLVSDIFLWMLLWGGTVRRLARACRRASNRPAFIPKAEISGYKWQWLGVGIGLQFIFLAIVGMIYFLTPLHHYISLDPLVTPTLALLIANIPACWLATAFTFKRMLHNGAATIEIISSAEAI
jgi:hypothetical protein